jgi:hypothetical protein
MQKYFKITMSKIFVSLLVTKAWAFDYVPSQNNDVMPIQPIFIYDDSLSVINPSKMVLFSVGKVWTRHHNDITQDIGNTFKKLKWFSDTQDKRLGIIFNNLEVKIEVPYYLDKVSLGFDYKRVTNNLKDVDLDSRFQGIATNDILASIKFKLPLSSKLGQFVLTLSPKIGFIFSHEGTGPAIPDSMRKFISYGWVGGTAFGIDYYLNQWFGLYGEWSVRYNGIGWFRHHASIAPMYLMSNYEKDRLLDAIKSTSRPDPYSYFTTSITFGIKSTF